jgi:hypothetical protein
MTISKINPGVDISFSTKLNNNFCISIRNNLLEHQRTLLDRVGVYSLGNQDLFGEAFSSETGRMSSITAATSIDTTMSVYNTTASTYIPGINYLAVSTDTTTTANSDTTGTWSNQSNAFDTNLTNYALYSVTNGMNPAKSVYIGKTFPSKLIKKIRIKASAYWFGDGAGSLSATLYLETYNGSTWSSVATLATGPDTSGTSEATFNGIYILNSTVQGIRLRFYCGRNNSSSANCAYAYTLLYGDDTEGTLELNIPSGRFPATISSFIANNIISDYETGADIQMKLTNATEDSGYFSIIKMTTPATFTAFTSEPTKAIIKLIPKSSNPTAGYPSIKSMAVYAE